MYNSVNIMDLRTAILSTGLEDMINIWSNAITNWRKNQSEFRKHNPNQYVFVDEEKINNLAGIVDSMHVENEKLVMDFRYLPKTIPSSSTLQKLESSSIDLKIEPDITIINYQEIRINHFIIKLV